MEIHLKPELEAKLVRLASDRGRRPDELVQEVVETFVDHDSWFRSEVSKGLAQLDQGQFLEHDEVVARY